MAEQLKVFVSHSHQDDAFCRQLVSALRDAGADVWYDEHNLGSGQLGPTIERELKERPVFVLILSPAALTSAWVEDETRWAYGLYRKDRTRTIQPVLAASVSEDDIWLFLQDFKRVEALGGKPYPVAEAVQRTLHALGLGAAGVSAPERGETAAELVTRGTALNSQKKYAEALPLFQRATQLDATSFSAWFNLGYTLSSMGHKQVAVLAYERATTIDPKNAIAWGNLAAALLKLGRNQEALAAAEQAITLDPKLARAWDYKAHALNGLGRFQEALAASERATTLGPNNAFHWRHKAAALIGLKRYQEALAAAEQALSLDRVSSYGWKQKAIALRGLGRIKDAEAAEARVMALRWPWLQDPIM